MDDKKSETQVSPFCRNIGMGNSIENKETGHNVLNALRASIQDSEDNARLGLGETFLPVDGFRPEIRDIFRDTAIGFDAHRDKCVLAALEAVAIVTGYKVSAKLKFMPYTNHASLYGLLIDESGGVKTAVNKYFLGPVDKLEMKARRRFQNEKEKYNSLTIEQQKGEKKPVKNLLMTKNYTPERLTQLASTSTTGVSFYRDELSGFYRSIGKYSANGKSEHIEQQLSLFDGILEANDRVSDLDELMESRETAFSTYGTIQPDVFDDIFIPLIQSKNGYFNRFLFVFPEPRKHQYIDCFNEVKCKPETWEAVINDIAQCPAGTVYEFDEAAGFRYASYINKYVIDEENKDLYSTNPFTAYLRRNRVNILRLAITIHVLNDWRSSTITDKEMDMAIRMQQTFNKYAQKCLDRLPSSKRSREVEDSPAELIKMAYRMNMAKGKPASAVNQSALAKMAEVSQAYVNKIKSSMISSGEISDDDAGDSVMKRSANVEDPKKDIIVDSHGFDEIVEEENETSSVTSENEVSEGDEVVTPVSAYSEETSKGDSPPTPPLPSEKSVFKKGTDNSEIPPGDNTGDGERLDIT